MKGSEAMNVYDFDKTIYDGDSTFDFLMFCAKKNKAVRKMLPGIALRGVLFLLGIIKKQDFKEKMFSFLTVIDVDKEVKKFWRLNIGNVKIWYAMQQKEDDMVISASPEFLVQGAMNLLDIKYMMASPVDKNTGKYYGKNCHGEEKVARLRESYPDAVIDEFYSDSYSDSPLAKLAKKAYLVKGDKLLPWSRRKLK